MLRQFVLVLKILFDYFSESMIRGVFRRDFNDVKQILLVNYSRILQFKSPLSVMEIDEMRRYMFFTIFIQRFEGKSIKKKYEFIKMYETKYFLISYLIF